MNRGEPIAKNLKCILFSEFLLAALKFLSRRVFVLLLGKEYLGINGLFTDILSVLSLAELGFGVSITYSLYRPVAQEDTELIKSLIRLYRRVYRFVGLIVLAVGVCLTPFLGFFVREMPENIPHLSFIYMLNIGNASVSYFFAYKATLLYVDQKKYIDAIIRAVVALVASAAQIAVLLFTRNYLYYMYLAIGATLVQNLWISLKTDRLYPYLREKQIQALPTEIKQDIWHNVSAMLLHRIGDVAVFSTDNLLISKFVGITTTGLYSNYTMIRGYLNLMVNALFHAVTTAMGRLNATAPIKERQTAFRYLNFFSGWLFGWMSICLFWLYDPFIDIWLGEGYLLPRPVVWLITAIFYMNSMRIPVANTRSVMGLFWDDRYKSLLEALLNLALSIALARRWGILGILAGTLISMTALPFWIEPLGLYRYGLKQPARTYFIRYILHLFLTIAAGALTGLFCRGMGEGLAGFLGKGLLCLLLPNFIYGAVYCRTPELRFIKNRLRRGK